jgi:8-oxo-dGTP diphosphatase
MTKRERIAAARPARVQVTVDVVIFTILDGALNVLLVRRGIAPFQGSWAIPGGFILEGESLEQAALRELREETGVPDVYLEQLYTFGDPGRDPRGRVITVAYYALIAMDRAPVEAGTDAAEARWWPMAALPKRLAFDHARIVDYAGERLRAKIAYSTVGFQLLPEEFTLGELQEVYEAILGRPLDKRNFRRRIELLDVLLPLERWRRAGPSRPARLYRFRAGSF